MNAVKKKLLRGEICFTAEAAKENFSILPAECGENNFSTLKTQILQLFTANFNAYLKLTGIIIELSHRWRSGIGGF